jgi:hypothetical protein
VQLSGSPSKLGSWPYSQTFDQAEMVRHIATSSETRKISFKPMTPGASDIKLFSTAK